MADGREPMAPGGVGYRLSAIAHHATRTAVPETLTISMPPVWPT